MVQDTIHRRTFLGGVAGMAGMAAAPGTFAQGLKLPTSMTLIVSGDAGSLSV